MYGMNVHRAVVANRENESGITIHYVNENYDEGAVIFQKSVELAEDDSPVTRMGATAVEQWSAHELPPRSPLLKSSGTQKPIAVSAGRR